MAVGDAYVFPGFLTPVLTQLFLPKLPTTFHASAEVRGENTPERTVTLTGDRTHNHQVMSPTRSPLSHPSGAYFYMNSSFIYILKYTDEASNIAFDEDIMKNNFMFVMLWN